MFPKRLIFIVIAAFLAFSVLGSISSGIQRDAWTQGYMAGRLEAVSAGGANAPLPLNVYPDYAVGYARPHFWGFGWILPVGLLVLLFVAGRRFAHFGGWRGGPGTPEGGAWGGFGFGHRPWQGGHGWGHGHHHGHGQHDNPEQQPPQPAQSQPEQSTPTSWQGGNYL